MTAQRLALGTVQFGLRYGVANSQGQVTADEGREILSEARSRGVDTLDTAAAYGGSETRLGEIGVGGWRIVTKLPPPPEHLDDAAAWVESNLMESLKRLQVQSAYGLLLHRPEQLLGSDAAVVHAALVRARERGLVRKIGVSVYEPPQLARVLERFEIDLVQAPFNILDTRLIEAGWLHRLKVRGIELHVRSVFLQGLLLMDRSARPASFDHWSPIWNALETWVAETGTTRMAACLRYALSFTDIDKVVVGVDSRAQLSEILDTATATNGDLPPLPPQLRTNDINLLNPALWARTH